MKKISFLLLFLLFLAGISAQQFRGDYRQKQMSWNRMASRIPDSFFTYQRDEAVRIADNLLLYQLNSGAWPKNTYFPVELTDELRKKVVAGKKNLLSGTIDNGATTTEIIFLSKVYNVTREKKYKKAALRAIDYLLEAQYDNGGWPQFYPGAQDYSRHITYNDHAMVNVMKLMRDISQCNPLYWYVPQSVREKAKDAFNKGVKCILATQVMQNGRPTVWCAQHHCETLEPVKARSYELPSLSGQESNSILMLLMDIPNPSSDVIAAVDNAVAWYEKSRIDGLRMEFYRNEEGKRDYRMVKSEKSRPLWARFYDLKTNEPFFCDRDGVKKYDLSEIGHERRTGYSWYSGDGVMVLQRYQEWKRALSMEQGSRGRDVNQRNK